VLPLTSGRNRKKNSQTRFATSGSTPENLVMQSVTEMTAHADWPLGPMPSNLERGFIAAVASGLAGALPTPEIDDEEASGYTTGAMKTYYSDPTVNDLPDGAPPVCCPRKIAEGRPGDNEDPVAHFGAFLFLTEEAASTNRGALVKRLMTLAAVGNLTMHRSKIEKVEAALISSDSTATAAAMTTAQALVSGQTITAASRVKAAAINASGNLEVEFYRETKKKKFQAGEFKVRVFDHPELESPFHGDSAAEALKNRSARAHTMFKELLAEAPYSHTGDFDTVSITLDDGDTITRMRNCGALATAFGTAFSAAPVFKVTKIQPLT